MNYNYCQNCGKVNAADGSFCSFCGHKLIPAKTRICFSCRKAINENDAFCRYCGEKCEPVKKEFSTFYALSDEEIEKYSYSASEQLILMGVSPDKPLTIKDNSENISKLMSQIKTMISWMQDIKETSESHEDRIVHHSICFLEIHNELNQIYRQILMIDKDFKIRKTVELSRKVQSENTQNLG